MNDAALLMSQLIASIPAIPATGEPSEAAMRLIELQYDSPAQDYNKYPIKAYHSLLGQTLCEACDHGVDMGEMLFVPKGENGYGYYHPECVLNDTELLLAFYSVVTQ